jgi:hypothetical protein
MFEYLFGSDQKKPSSNLYVNIKKENIIKPPKPITIFVVSDKNSLMPIGVFDTLEAAKTSGGKVTYHNYNVTPFVINSQCKYLNNPVYE